ncbi:MAG: HAMP domain-containing sensor histidine kinase [Planctomycetota bacterium]
MKFRSGDETVVKISAEVADDVVTVKIHDNGIGIPDERQDDVFTIFRRLGFKENAPGIGIGLAICRRIVLRHSGRIGCQSPTEGNGIVFFMTFRLPG